MPELPELPELPDVALLPLLDASPVLPELALPDFAMVSEEGADVALPVDPPRAEPVAVLEPELPEVTDV